MWVNKLFAVLFSMVIFLCSCAKHDEVLQETFLTYWSSSSQQQDMPLTKELARQTGIHIDFIHPGGGSLQEQLDRLYFANNLPDIIETSSSIEGGIFNLIDRGYVLRLNELIEQCSLNFMQYLEENPVLRKKIDFGGNYYVYPFVRSTKSLKVYSGPCVRTDWLEEMGLPLPETLDEWYITLTAFRDQFGCEIPFLHKQSNAPFMYAYGIINGFYLKNGQIYYGYTQPEYKEYLRMMRQWYQDGLFGVDYPNAEYGSMDRMIIDGVCGAGVGSAGKSLGNILKSGIPVEGTKYPVLNKGDRSFCSNFDASVLRQGAAAISVNCRDPKAAAQFLDFGYSREGVLLYNFGVEGESYYLSDGRPKYTDLILNSEDISATMDRYLRANNSGPFIQMQEYMEQYCATEVQKRSWRRWQETDADVHIIEDLYLTQAQRTELDEMQFEAYAKEMELRFIMGLSDLEYFDQYVEHMNELGVKRALEIYDAAMDKFNRE